MNSVERSEVPISAEFIGLGLVCALETSLKAIADNWLERKLCWRASRRKWEDVGVAFLVCFPIAPSLKALISTQKACGRCVLSPQPCYGIPDCS